MTPQRIGPMVETLMTARGVTAVTLAAALKIHRNRLSDKIAGRTDFKESEILQLAAYFGVPVARLFDDPLELLGATPNAGSESAWIRTALAA